MARRSPRRAGTNGVVLLLVAAIVAFCALHSYREKHGPELAIQDIGISAFHQIYEAVSGFVKELYGGPAGKSHMDNAMAVSAGAEEAALSVHFLDVGQAKCVLIKAPGKTVLIDAGENDRGSQILRYLREQNVQKLDIAIGTHPHADHIGGMDTVLGGIQVEAIILPEVPEDLVPTTQTYTDLLMAIINSGLSITVATPGDTYDLGGGAELAILAPAKDYPDLNNMSVVARLTYGETAFLFTGDASAQAELDLVGADVLLRADVLDVGHHGSATATGEEFLKQVAPAIAVISCGADNSYGHPHREVVERLTRHHAQILRTDLQGTIVLTSDGAYIGIQKEKG